jgi:two-component system chemotaxis response regulator CheY
MSAAPRPIAADDPVRILVVDDDPAMCTLLESLLSRLGQVEVAASGFDGITRFRNACETGRPFRLVCLDILMPGMDGHRTLAALRRMEWSSPTPGLGAQILMLTAVNDRAAVQRAVAAGCDGYLVKPFTGDEVLRKLQTLGFDIA